MSKTQKELKEHKVTVDGKEYKVAELPDSSQHAYGLLAYISGERSRMEAMLDVMNAAEMSLNVTILEDVRKKTATEPQIILPQ